MKPAVVVQFISSNSCSGVLVTNHQFKVEDEVIATIKKQSDERKENITEIAKTTPTSTKEIIPAIDSKKHSVAVWAKVSGNLSLSSYSNKSNGPSSADFQHWRFNLAVDADSVARSPLFFSSYVNFAYRADKWSQVTNNIGQALKIYDLAIRYDFSSITKITLGRKINFKTSSLGAIDGLQFETSIKKFVLGVVAGSHPSFTDYGYDVKMFEYGGYVYRSDTLNTVAMQNTLGVFEQTNNFKTDRRFLYFQHTNNLTPTLGFFVSSEFDLYKKQKGVSKSIFDMTSLFAMCSFNPSSWFGLSTSYDARKNVIYYETFKTYADSILESATRQGLTARINLRPFNYVWLGFNYGYRFSKDDPRPSKNYGVNFNYLLLPFISSSLNLNFNRIESGYVTGNYYGASLSKDLFSGEMNLSAGYKKIEYKFPSGAADFFQHVGNLDLSWRIIRSLFFTMSYEGTFQDKLTYGRLYLSLSQRF
jgi:hypothetical protein